MDQCLGSVIPSDVDRGSYHEDYAKDPETGHVRRLDHPGNLDVFREVVSVERRSGYVKT
jgi:hypothetical protein